MRFTMDILVKWFHESSWSGMKEWKRLDFQADRYTSGILEKMQNLYVYQPVTIVERDALVQEWQVW